MPLPRCMSADMLCTQQLPCRWLSLISILSGDIRYHPTTNQVTQLSLALLSPCAGRCASCTPRSTPLLRCTITCCSTSCACPSRSLIPTQLDVSSTGSAGMWRQWTVYSTSPWCSLPTGEKQCGVQRKLGSAHANCCALVLSPHVGGVRLSSHVCCVGFTADDRATTAVVTEAKRYT